MKGEALGLIEAIGLPAAIAAADTAAKAANIQLLGYELTKGGGLVTVKLIGDVAAVKAAVDAGAAEAKRVHVVWAVHVIPRPASGVEAMVIAETISEREVEETQTPAMVDVQTPEAVRETTGTTDGQIPEMENVDASKREPVQESAPKANGDQDNVAQAKPEKRNSKRKTKPQEPENGTETDK